MLRSAIPISFTSALQAVGQAEARQSLGHDGAGAVVDLAEHDDSLAYREDKGQANDAKAHPEPRADLPIRDFHTFSKAVFSSGTSITLPAAIEVTADLAQSRWRKVKAPEISSHDEYSVQH
jgi:hypothetical protein